MGACGCRAVPDDGPPGGAGSPPAARRAHSVRDEGVLIEAKLAGGAKAGGAERARARARRSERDGRWVGGWAVLLEGLERALGVRTLPPEGGPSSLDAWARWGGRKGERGGMPRTARRGSQR